MNALAGAAQFDATEGETSEQHDVLELSITPWGYILNGKPEHESAVRAIASRFFGVILLFAGAGLLVIPDSVFGAEVFAMKLGAMLMFFLFGGVLVWHGRKRPGVEVQVDTKRRELRLGSRTISGDFHLADMLRFDEVSSVYLMRNGAEGRPSRLYLRVGAGGHTGIEILRGPQRKLERVRVKLMEDLGRMG